MRAEYKDRVSYIYLIMYGLTIEYRQCTAPPHSHYTHVGAEQSGSLVSFP